jgi:hypothetical protein
MNLHIRILLQQTSVTPIHRGTASTRMYRRLVICAKLEQTMYYANCPLRIFIADRAAYPDLGC